MTWKKEFLLKDTKDARLHFALVCAAKGCPKIIEEAYQPDQLDSQLDRQTSLAVNDPTFIKVDYGKNTASLSQIFEWYKGGLCKGAFQCCRIHQFLSR